MITPRFSVSQSDALVIVEISVPHIRVSAAEFHINDETFSFYCKPYLLKLSFPGALEDSEERPATAVYDPDKNHGTIVCSVPKQSPGEHFEDMDMMSKLLQPHLPVPTRIIPSAASGGGGSGGGIGGGGGSSSIGGGGGGGGVRSGGPLIEVISSEDFATGDGDGDGDGDGGGSDGSDVSDGSEGSGEGKLQGSNAGATTGRDPDEAARSLLWGLPSDMVGVELGKPRYGFNDEREGWFTDLRGELVGCVELPVPDQTPAGLRCRLREAAEKARFDGNRYQADRTFGDEDPLYQESRSFVPWWDHLRATEEAATEEAATEEAAKGVPQPAVDALADGLGSLSLGVQSVGGSPSNVPPSDPPSEASSVVSSSVLADAAALGGAANASPGGEGKGESESDAAAAAAAVVEAVVDSVAVNSLMGAVVDSVVDQASSIAVAAGASAGEQQKGSSLVGEGEGEVEDGSSSGEYETSSEEEESSSAEEDSDWEFGGSSDDAMDSDDDLALFESTAAGVGQENDTDTGAASSASAASATSAAGAGAAGTCVAGKGAAAGKGGGVDGGEAKEEVPSKPSTPLPPATTVVFTETEREQMSKLPRKEQLVAQDCQAAPMGLHHWALLASVADVIFGYETEEPAL